MHSPKIFISFASQDRALATRLHQDLTKRGGEVFHFLETATIGDEAWEQVLNEIGRADYFIVLLSKASCSSAPVRAEIDFAFHQYINNKKKPTLIPAIVERVDKPKKLKVFTELPIGSAYDDAVRKLVQRTGLDEQASAGGRAEYDTGKPSRVWMVTGATALILVTGFVAAYVFKLNGAADKLPGVYLSEDATKGSRVTSDMVYVVTGESGYTGPMSYNDIHGFCLVESAEANTRLAWTIEEQDSVAINVCK